MKKILFYQILIASIVLQILSLHGLSAQSPKRNMIQIKYNMNYFKGYENYYLSGILLPNFAYTKFYKDSPMFIGFEMDELNLTYQKMHRVSDIGDVVFRAYIMVESKIGYQLALTNRISLLAKTGLGLRFGQEGIVTAVFPSPALNGYGTVIIHNRHYQDVGIEAAIEFLYRFSKRWSLSLGGGEQFFLTRIATKNHLRANFGIGYSF